MSAFVIIGELLHTSRLVSRRASPIIQRPNGSEAVRFYDSAGIRRYLAIPKTYKATEEYRKGLIYPVKLAILARMKSGEACDAGRSYIRQLVEKQVEAGAAYLDLNVDEMQPGIRKSAMVWLVQVVQSVTATPVCVDSSQGEVIEAGLDACGTGSGAAIANSATVKRMDVLDLARKYGSKVIVTAAGKEDLPEDNKGRVENVRRMVEETLARGFRLADVFIDPLMFPIRVSQGSGVQCLAAIRNIREAYGREIHITGGFSNVSFGLPARQIVNQVFMNLAVSAGADSGIINPVTCHPDRVLEMDRDEGYELAEDLLLGKDDGCERFLDWFEKR